MSWLRDLPVKRKLYAIIMGTAAVVLLLSLLATMVVQTGAAREAAQAQLRALATVLSANSRAVVAFRDREAAAEILATLETQQDVVSAAIRLQDGEIFAEYVAPRFAGKAASTASRGAVAFGLDRLVVEQPIRFDDKVIGRFSLVGDLGAVRDILIRQAALVLAVFVVAMLLALFLSSRLQRMVSVPVQRLLDVMAGVASTRDFSRRADRVSNDEFGHLTDGFNDMLDRIHEHDGELARYREGLEEQVIQRTEELELARQRAEAASRAKSEFLATMSHEIRTPMTGVIGFTRLLEKTELNDQQRDYTRIIGSSAHSLLEIINEILDYSKMEAGKVELEARDFSVSDLLDTVVGTLRPRALEKGIELATAVAGEVPPVLHGDPLRLRQVLLNLVGNAVKFTEYGMVRVVLETVGQHGAEVTLRFTIEDTGIGISADQLGRLFQPFQQADGSITRRFGGTGLGLVIAQRLVRMMHGEIRVVSTPGSGSTFFVTVCLSLPDAVAAGRALPTGARRQARPLVSAEEVAPALARLRVLVVDDSPINLKLATALLVSRGVAVSAVESADEALALIEQQVFDLVLMDLEMPVMSGVEAAAKIRASASAAASMPIIAVTAHAFPEKRQEVIEAGMNDLLTKPYLPEQLYAMIAKWCGGLEMRPAAADADTVVAEGRGIRDHEAALAIVNGDDQVARSMLDDFLGGLAEAERILRQTHTARDYEGLFQAIHKLAGAAPLVGATALYRATVSLQNFLKLEPLPVERIEAGVSDVLQQIAAFRDHTGDAR